MENEKSHCPPFFGARAAGLILIGIVIAYLTLDYSIGAGLEYFQGSANLSWLQDVSDQEILAIERILNGIVDPFLLVALTLLLLRDYFPGESAAAILKRFGLQKSMSTLAMLISFAGGIAFVLFFRKLLMNVFPPNEFVEDHPANIVANTSTWAQLAFAITLVTVVPIAEEFFFRGVLYKGFSNSWNKIISALVISVIFVSFHPETFGSGYWVTHLALYVIPFVLIIVREVTGSLEGSIMIHSGFNFGAIFIP